MNGQAILSFRVPSGIGDISWIYSKLASLNLPLRIEVAAGNPKRALPYLELLPMVQEAVYGDFLTRAVLDAPDLS